MLDASAKSSSYAFLGGSLGPLVTRSTSWSSHTCVGAVFNLRVILWAASRPASHSPFECSAESWTVSGQ